MIAAGTMRATGTSKLAPALRDQLLQEVRIAVERTHVAGIFEFQAQPDRADRDFVAERHPLHDRRRKVDHHVLDAAVLAGHGAAFALGLAAEHGRRIADAGVDAVADVDLVVGMPRADAGLDVVADESERAVPDPDVERDPPDAGQDARDAVVTDVVDGAGDAGRRDLAVNRHRRPAGADWYPPSKAAFGGGRKNAA